MMKPSRIVASSSLSSSTRRTQQQQQRYTSFLPCHRRRHSVFVSHYQSWNEKRLLIKGNKQSQSLLPSLGHSISISTTTCNDAPITLSSQVGSASSSSSMTTGTTSNNTTNTNYNDKRLLSSLSTVPSTASPTAATDVVNNNNNNINHSLHQRSISKKNLEVMCLLQSLQNVVETQRSLGLFHRDLSLNQEKKNDIVSMSQFLTPWQEFDHNMDTIFDMKLLSSSSSTTTTTTTAAAAVIKSNQDLNTNDVVAEQLNQQMKKNKQWYIDLKKAVDKRDKQKAMDLFYNMERDTSFLHIVYNTNNSKTNIKPFFRTMNKLINSMRLDRLDVAFDVFSRTQNLCQLFENHLNDRVRNTNGKNKNMDEKMMQLLKEQNKMNDDELNFRLQQVKECRELLLFSIISSMQLGTESNSSAGKVLRRQTYIKMVQHLFRIIRNDIRGDPILQLSLLSQFMVSLMRQRFCSTREMKRTEKYIWDVSLSLLKTELEKAQFTRANGNYGEDGMNQVGNMNPAFENEGHDYDSFNNEISDLEPTQDVADENCNEFSTTHCRKLAGILPKFEALLDRSTFRTQTDLPFVKLLEIIVSNGMFPIDYLFVFI